MDNSCAVIVMNISHLANSWKYRSVPTHEGAGNTTTFVQASTYPVHLRIRDTKLWVYYRGSFITASPFRGSLEKVNFTWQLSTAACFFYKGKDGTQRVQVNHFVFFLLLCFTNTENSHWRVSACVISFNISLHVVTFVLQAHILFLNSIGFILL